MWPCGPKVLANQRRPDQEGLRKGSGRNGGEGGSGGGMAPWTRSVGAKESCLKQAFKVLQAGFELDRLGYVLDAVRCTGTYLPGLSDLCVAAGLYC